jgi:hypothetical protein
VVLWFAVEDLDAAVDRLRALGAPVLVEPTENPGAGHREYWVRHPDGYTLVVAG